MTEHAAPHHRDAARQELAVATVREFHRLLPARVPVAVVLVAVLAPRVRVGDLLVWLAVLVLDVVGARLRFARSLRDLQQGAPTGPWLRREIPFGVVFGVTQSLPALVAVRSGDAGAMNIAIFVNIGVAAVSVGTTAIRPLYAAVLAGLLVPTVACAVAFGHDARAIGVLGIPFGALMLGVHSRLSRAVHEAVEIKYANAALAEELAREHTVAQLANDQLSHVNAQLTHRASHDPLTGLANRSLALDTLATAVLGAAPGAMVAVLYADLDGFKPINDTHGHQVGDHVLVAVARRLAAAVNSDDLVCRLGGDEFVVVVRGLARQADAEGIGERLRRAVDLPLAIDGLTVQVGVSIGVALADRPCVAKELMRQADDALYEAKHSGRGRVLVAPMIRPAPLQAARRA